MHCRDFSHLGDLDMLSCISQLGTVGAADETEPIVLRTLILRALHIHKVFRKFLVSTFVYLCSCHMLLAEFRTSATLTGFHVFALKFSKHFENVS